MKFVTIYFRFNKTNPVEPLELRVSQAVCEAGWLILTLANNKTRAFPADLIKEVVVVDESDKLYG